MQSVQSIKIKIRKIRNMKNLSIVLIAVAIGIFFTSCEKIVGDGLSVTEHRPISNFTSLASAISADVIYKQGPAYTVEITAQQNIINVIETNVVGSELVIKFKDFVRVKDHERITVNVSSPTINGLRISGSGNITAADSIVSDNMALTLSGSGNIRLSKLVTSSLDANISGSGSISLSGGILSKEHLKISGSGDINTGDASANNVTTVTSGSGEMQVIALKTLDVTISGSGSVYYDGAPIVNAHISGSGKVIHK